MRPCSTNAGSLLKSLLLAWMGAVGGHSETLTLHTLRRVPAPADTNEWQTIEQPVTWNTQHTAMVLCDLTDAMYNHRSRPWVSHFRGTELVAEHIEKYWCPTATSADLLGGEPFRFKDDIRKRIVLLIAENEYRTWETLPAFARRELAWRGYEIDFVTASQRTDDFDFQNWTAIPKADLLVISARRRALPKPMMDALRTHLAAAKPVVGLRTASHAFDPADKTLPEERTWRRFDREILGAQYQNHYGSGSKTVVRRTPGAANHPLLNGVDPQFQSASPLYRNRHPAATVTLLLEGQLENGQSEAEPVAWVNLANNRRVFYTSLGSPADFDNPSFRRLLLNGILWTLNDVVPPP